MLEVVVTMPFVDEFKCTDCGFTLPRGWGGCFYVEIDKSSWLDRIKGTAKLERVKCLHPGECRKIRELLLWREKIERPSQELVNERVGFLSHCICIGCLHQFDADYGHYYFSINHGYPHENGARPEKDKRECPNCKSANVKTEEEMVDQYCPKCKKGVISRSWTGAVS